MHLSVLISGLIDTASREGECFQYIHILLSCVMNVVVWCGFFVFFVLLLLLLLFWRGWGGLARVVSANGWYRSTIVVVINVICRSCRHNYCYCLWYSWCRWYFYLFLSLPHFDVVVVVVVVVVVIVTRSVFKYCCTQSYFITLSVFRTKMTI